MIYFKYLDLNWKPASKKLLEYINDNKHLLDPKGGSWVNVSTRDVLSKVPELAEMVAPLNATIRYLAFFITYNYTGRIHIDDDNYSKCRINIPVLNCENSQTRFYKTVGKTTRTLQQNKVVFNDINIDDCEYQCHFELTKAVLFRNTEPHQVVSANVVPRISCTIGLNEDLSYLLGE